MEEATIDSTTIYDIEYSRKIKRRNLELFLDNFKDDCGEQVNHNNLSCFNKKKINEKYKNKKKTYNEETKL